MDFVEWSTDRPTRCCFIALRQKKIVIGHRKTAAAAAADWPPLAIARRGKADANRRRRRGERSGALERAGRPAGAGWSEGGGGGGRKERRDGLRTGERPLKEKADEVRERRDMLTE